MNWRIIIGNLGTILRLFSLTLLVPLLLGLVLEPRTTATPVGVNVAGTTSAFAYTFLATLVIGFLLERIGLSADFRDREAYVLVGVGWMACTFVAATPYMLTGVLTNPADAFFEAMSGLTTTGATVIDVPLEGLPAGVHVWRALTQWLGGMGIVVLTVAVVSRLASAGARLMQAELPGGKVDRVRPGIIQTARSLWRVYARLSLALFVILFALIYKQFGSFQVAGLDAIVHTFTTMSTGGFSTRSLSIEAFQNPWIEWTIIVFMVLAGTNFALSYRALMGRPSSLFGDDEFRFFLTILGGGAVLVTSILLLGNSSSGFWGEHGGRSFWTSLRLAAFQTVSLVTTTGYSTANFDAFPEVARFLAIFAMFIGGSTGSTGGSIKVARILILFRMLKAELRRIAHPRAVIPIRIGREVVGALTLQRVTVFIFAYLTLFIAGTIAFLALEPVSVLDGASAVAACIGNIGPALGAFGPHVGYASVGEPGTVLLALLMWVGRLELFAVLVLFSPETYR